MNQTNTKKQPSGNSSWNKPFLVSWSNQTQTDIFHAALSLAQGNPFAPVAEPTVCSDRQMASPVCVNGPITCTVGALSGRRTRKELFKVKP